MFGRARLDLLSRRCLRAPQGGQALAPGQRAPSRASAEAKAASPRVAPAVGLRSDARCPAAASRQTRGPCRSGQCCAYVGACRVSHVLDLPDVVSRRRIGTSFATITKTGHEPTYLRRSHFLAKNHVTNLSLYATKTTSEEWHGSAYHFVQYWSTAKPCIARNDAESIFQYRTF